MRRAIRSSCGWRTWNTDLPPPAIAREVTHAAIEQDEAKVTRFEGHLALREAAAEHVRATTGSHYDPGTQCVSVAGGLNGILNVLLAVVEPGRRSSSAIRSMPGWSTASGWRAGSPGTCGASRVRAGGLPIRTNWPRRSARGPRPCC